MYPPSKSSLGHFFLAPCHFGRGSDERITSGVLMTLYDALFPVPLFTPLHQSAAQVHLYQRATEKVKIDALPITLYCKINFF